MHKHGSPLITTELSDGSQVRAAHVPASLRKGESKLALTLTASRERESDCRLAVLFMTPLSGHTPL